MASNSLFKDKTILITGGTGSFGRAFAKRLLEEDECRKVIIFSRDEWKQWEIKQSDPIYDSPKIRYFIGDVRDRQRLMRAFNEVNYIIHAAALKQVPAAEYNPTEFIQTNVNGAMNVIDAAIDSGVEKVIALSTDKAVKPINLYGATKLCSDKLFVAANSYVGAKGIPTLSVVRYGNVIGSRGSVLPYWSKLISENATYLPLTDERMTRFWITLDQAVDFTYNCFKEARGGEIFIPKIPSVRVIDLAKALAPALPLHYTGIREGEKLHELMIGIEDARHTVELEKFYIIIPETYIHNETLMDRFIKGREGQKLKEGFSYGSDNNNHWLKKEELEEVVGPFKKNY